MARFLLRLSLVALSLALALTVALQARMPREVVEVLALPNEMLGLAVTQPTAQPAAATPTAPLPVATPVPAPASEPSTVVLQQDRDGYLGAADTFVQFYGPENNYCAAPELSVVTTDKAVAFLRFDLTALPAAARVVTATFEVYALQGNQGVEIGLYLPRRDWDACSITWTKPWEQPGANGAVDRETEPLQAIKTGPAPEWLRFDVTAAAEQWLHDPSSNHGLILKSLEASVPSQHILVSSENADAGRRPRLTIEYTLAPPAPEPLATPLPAETPEAVSPTSTSPEVPAPAPIATATAITPGSPRVIELHWWNPMEVGQSYPVSVVFRPEAPGPGAGGYDVYVLGVNAQLGAATMDLASDSAQLQILTDPKSSLVWHWTLQPCSTGERTLDLDLNFGWTPAVPGQPPVRTEPGTWQETRTARVNAAFGYWPLIRVVRLGLMGAGLLLWLGWLVLRLRRSEH